MFDVYYIGENTKLKEALPFATPVTTNDSINPRTKMYWLVEPNIEITDLTVFEYRPPDHDQAYEHVWKWSSKNYGGVKLLPRASAKGTKEINRVVCRKSFDILHTPTPNKYFESHPYATHVWCVDPEYKLNSDIDWAPDNFEPNFIHSFHLRGQLEHKYPQQEGGIKLYPREWTNAKIKYHTFLDAGVEYPVLYVSDVNDYTQRDKFSNEYVWLVDLDHRINTATLNWVPNPFERSYIHSFRMPYQLTEKYPQAMGGIRLVPRDWKKSELKIHPSCPVKDEKYDVFYVNSDDFNEDTYTELADRAKTDWFWVVDREYDFNGELLFVPAKHEQDYIHVFKVPGMLDERYPEQVTEPWDNRCGGVRLVNRNFDMTKHKYHDNVIPVRYDIFYTSDINNLDTYARKSTTKMFWLVDVEHNINDVFKYLPKQHDQKYIHVFKLAGQLEHKYPKEITNTSDNRCGGIKLVPVKYNLNDIKYVNKSPTGSKNYPIVFVSNVDELSSVTEDCWILDSEYQVDAVIQWSPPDFQKNYMHVFHVKGQLKHKYPESMGGARWVPVDWNGQYVIHSNELDVGKTYPVIRVDDPTDLSQATSECWLIDRLYNIDAEYIEWLPPVYEKNMIHVFHVKGQLTNKYTESMGGAYWVPADPSTAEVKVHTEFLPVASNRYPVNFVDNPNNFKTAPIESWWVDKEYRIDDVIDVIPWQNEKEMHMVHVFHVKDQLLHKYSDTMGGAYWIPAQWNGDFKVHSKPLEIAKQYPIIAVDDPTVPPADVKESWVVDKLYNIKGKISWAPDDFDDKMIHVFHVKDQLTAKYTENMGGAYWYPNSTATEIKVHPVPLALHTNPYPVIRVDNPSDWSGVEDDCWLVDSEYILEDSAFDLVPWQNETEKNMVHVYHVAGQLEHKYPEAMGGVYWVPANHKDAEIKIHDTTPFGEQLTFEVFATEEEGRLKCKNTTGWFWVVDPNVELLPDFKLDYVPKVWDAGKTHVWQKLNPVTGRQYDYAGVMLCPRVPQAKGRPKYIREAACTQKEFPVFNLDPQLDIIEQLTHIDSTVTNSMYWVVDPFTQVNPDFKFDYYPTQWDQQNVHVFADEDGAYRNIRLYPQGTFANTYTVEEIANNSFEKLKQINNVGSLRPRWPVLHLRDVTKAELVNALQESVNQGIPFLWTVDPDVSVDTRVLDAGYLPELTNIDRVHVWQRVNPHTEKVHSYGGLRLWPTGGDYTALTTDSIRLNKIKNIQYVKAPGCTYKPYDIVFLSYNEPGAENAYKRLTARFPATWVKDIAGIFEAHKAAASSVNSKMFWVVDADAWIEDTFNFDYVPDVYDQDVVHVWSSRNPVTGQEYGYGGVKLFNREQILNATSWGLDFTTGLSTRFKAMPEVSCITRFNTDAYSTWRSAFRECVKLALKDDAESQERLDGWLHPVPDAYFRHEAIRGADEGRAYAQANRNNVEALARINDYEWLRNRYDQH